MPLNPLQHVKRWFRKSSRHSNVLPEPRIIPRDQHTISRKDISRAALDVLYGLHNAGYDAYLVGGCLRDLLCGNKPKDFDVVTNATPEEIIPLFRRSRLIGRRFQIVHVRFGREIIEVSTFRAMNNESSPDKQQHHAHAETGMLLRDNTWGNIQQDAMRRDFTINALYYNIADFALYDFVGSVDAIESRQISLIGDPPQRYREDPVRLLRAARFAAKLDFDIAPATLAPMREMSELLLQVPPARLFDEVLKLFLSGYGREAYAQLLQLDLLMPLFPATAALLESSQNDVWQRMIEEAMDNTDTRMKAGKPVNPAFIFAVMLWPVVQDKLPLYRQEGMPPAQALHKAATRALNKQVKHTAIPRRFSTMMREMWELQFRLDRRAGKRADQLMEHPRFRAAYDFLLLREASGELTPGLGEWWTRYQDADESQRRTMISALSQQPAGAKRKRRRRKKPSQPSSAS